ncbi:MAG: response regulator [Deltaproteobacteria bacterium]|nr:response regulator [Deltaproteobacteria bacterium]
MPDSLTVEDMLEGGVAPPLGGRSAPGAPGPEFDPFADEPAFPEADDVPPRAAPAPAAPPRTPPPRPFDPFAPDSHPPGPPPAPPPSAPAAGFDPFADVEAPSPPPPSDSVRVLLAGPGVVPYGPPLTAAGFSIATANSGVEALAALDTFLPDFVITALQLGDLAGLDVAKAAKAVHPSARFLVLDAPNNPQLVVRALGEGALAFLPQGSAPDRVVSALRTARTAPPVAQGVLVGQQPHAQTPVPPPASPLPAVVGAVLPPGPAAAGWTQGTPTGAGFGTRTPAGAGFPPGAGRPGGPPVAGIPVGAPPHELNAARQQIQVLEAELAAARQQLAQARAELGAGRAQLGVLEGELAGARQGLAHAEAQGQAQVAQMQTLQARSAQMAAQLNAMQGQLAQAQASQADAQAAQASGAGRLAALQQQLAQVMAEGGAQRARAQSLEAELAPLRDRVAVAEGARAQAEQELTVLRAMEGSKEQERSHAQLAEARALQAEARVAQLEAQSSQAANDTAAYRDRLRTVEGELAQAQQRAALHAGAAQEAQAAQQEVATLRARQSKLESDLAVAQQAQEQLEELQMSLDVADETRKAVENEAAQLRAQVAEAANLRAAAARATSAEQARAQAEQSLQQAWAEVDHLKADVRRKDLELIQARTTAQAPAAGANPDEVRAQVEKATADIRRLVEAVAPLAWGVEQAVEYVDRVGSGAEKEAHTRQLRLLLKVLSKLKEKAGG